MLTVTQQARAHLSELLKHVDANEEMAIRFVREGRGLALQIDGSRDGDTTFDHEGRTVLLLDEEVKDALTEHTLDVEDTEEGPRLSLK